MSAAATVEATVIRRVLRGRARARTGCPIVTQEDAAEAPEYVGATEEVRTALLALLPAAEDVARWRAVEAERVRDFEAVAATSAGRHAIDWTVRALTVPGIDPAKARQARRIAGLNEAAANDAYRWHHGSGRQAIEWGDCQDDWQAIAREASEIIGRRMFEVFEEIRGGASR